MKGKHIAKEIATWFFTIVLALLFAMTGLRKFPGNSEWASMFRGWGYPDWFRLLIAVVETAAAAFLLYPRTAAYAAGTIIVVMLGALGTLAVHGPTRQLITPAVAIVLAIFVAAIRWRQRIVIARGRPLAPQR